jgi:hypothetical protein
MKYRVAVTEVYRLIVSVDAPNEEEAHRRASDAWNNTEFLLDKECFEGVEFHVLGEGSEGEQIDEKGVCI